MAMSKAAQKVLLRAAKHISNGMRWQKGAFLTEHKYREPTYCALGAVMLAQRELHDARHTILGEVDAALKRTIAPQSWTSVPHFNDALDTTHADVHKMFCDTVKREVTDVDDESE